MIVCRSAAEIEKLARVNALVARVLQELAAVTGGRGGAGVQGLPRLPGDDLRVGE